VKRQRAGSLGRPFTVFWTGQTVSMVGDQLTLFVVPTLMIFALDASAFQVGLIGMAQYLGIPVLGPVAGVLIDRWDKRRTLIGCDLIRLLAVAVIPIAYWRGVLTTPLLFVCVAAVSGATIFFTVGYLIAVPAAVDKDGLVSAYSRLEGSRTVSGVAGPSIAAGLYHLMGAGALVVDAATYAWSALCFRRMPDWGTQSDVHERILPRLLLGFRLNWADPVLRRVIVAAVILNSGGPIVVTVLPILAYRGLGLTAGAFGLAMSVAAVGAFLGALAAPRISARWGMGRTFAFALLAHNLVALGVLTAPTVPPALAIAVTMGCYGFFMSCINVCSAPIRQSRMSVHNQGIMHAAFRTATWGIIPLAALTGGLLVTLLTPTIGVLDAARVTMVAGTLLAACSFLSAVRVQPLLDREAAARELAGATS
jgi:MFS family permease